MEYRSRVAHSSSHPVFTVKLTDGLAKRNRLPLEHVLRVLTEMKSLLEEVGKRLQREHGAEKATGDFGLELEAGFKRGSVQANILITRNIATGVEAATHVIHTLKRLNPGPRRQARQQVDAEFDHRVLARLNNTSKILEIDKTSLRLELTAKDHDRSRRIAAVFDEATAEIVSKYQEATFQIENITLWGRLRGLLDQSTDEDEGKYFTGELLLDSGETWRVKFKAADKPKARELWSTQVYLIGGAFYYRMAGPRIVVTEFGADEPRDYEAAFDELHGLNADLYQADLKTLLHEIRGD